MAHQHRPIGTRAPRRLEQPGQTAVGSRPPLVSAGLFMRTLRRCFLTGARATKLIIRRMGSTPSYCTAEGAPRPTGVQFPEACDRQPTAFCTTSYDQRRINGTAAGSLPTGISPHFHTTG